MARTSKSTTSTPNHKNDDVSNSVLPKAATVTPTPTPRSTTKRKAPPQDAIDAPTPGSAGAGGGSNTSTTAKKPKIEIRTTIVTSTPAGKKKPTTHHHSSAHIEIPIPSATATTSTPLAKSSGGKHIVFDNDEDAAPADGPSEFFTPREAPAQNPLEAQLASQGDGVQDSGSDSDSDEAPEAVSTSAAAVQAAQSAQSAANAAEKQDEALRRRRQERDSRLKAQAEARNSKKKKQQQQQQHDAAKDEDEGEDEDDAPPRAEAPAATGLQGASRTVTSTATSIRRRVDRRALPAVLPEEFLASDDDSDEDDASSAGPRKLKSKKIKFSTAARQAARAGEAPTPADRRLGATVYRVAKRQGDQKHAPRGGKYSKNAREGLLRRGRTVPAATAGAKKRVFLARQ